MILADNLLDNFDEQSHRLAIVSRNNNSEVHNKISEPFLILCARNVNTAARTPAHFLVYFKKSLVKQSLRKLTANRSRDDYDYGVKYTEC